MTTTPDIIKTWMIRCYVAGTRKRFAEFKMAARTRADAKVLAFRQLGMIDPPRKGMITATSLGRAGWFTYGPQGRIAA